MNRRLLVDLEALAANYRLFARAADGGATGSVVKADAYGTGAATSAARLVAEGCRSFFVASPEEGLALRRGLGPGPEIFVFEGVDADDAPALAGAGIIPVLNHPGQLESWRPFAASPAAVHVDTGMSRLGFPADGIDDVDFSGFNLTLLMTHLACADEPEHALNDVQLRRFDVVKRHFPGIRTSVGNSAGCLSSAARRGDLGRPGIGLYGGNPFVTRANPCRPVAALQGRVLQIKALDAGASVGYGATRTLSERTPVAVVGIGYADGVSRYLSGRGEFFLAGRRCPILGRVSMDLTVVDVSGAPGAAVGDWAECFGANIGIDEVAASVGTIPYTLLTGVGARVPRVFEPLEPG
ncbi:MAG: alanine racemase [Pseudomonadales bacterium]